MRTIYQKRLDFNLTHVSEMEIQSVHRGEYKVKLWAKQLYLGNLIALEVESAFLLPILWTSVPSSFVQ